MYNRKRFNKQTCTCWNIKTKRNFFSFGHFHKWPTCDLLQPLFQDSCGLGWPVLSLINFSLLFTQNAPILFEPHNEASPAV